jgi:septation ring formation regulator EzrA
MDWDNFAVKCVRHIENKFSEIERLEVSFQFTAEQTVADIILDWLILFRRS